MTSFNGFTFTNLSGGDILSNPDSFTNPSNATDDNDSTTADLTTLSAGSEITKTLGTTFTSETITVIRVKADIDMNIGSTSYAGEIQLQGYNGATWIKLLTLGTTTSQTLSVDTLVRGSFTVQGLRIAFISTVDSGNNVDMDLWTLSYGTSFTYTPKILLASLGGTNLEDLSDKTAISEDHTATWDLMNTKRIDGDGFILVDTTNIDLSSTGDKRTYTFNKDVNAVKVYFSNATGPSTGTARLELKKNGSTITTVVPLSEDQFVNGNMSWSTTGNELVISDVSSSIGVLVPESFTSTDTLILSCKTAGTGALIDDIVVEGFNNRTTDTTWVTIT